jgi:ATP-dependent exoDNAse (exonuclease V) alpha subunit
MGKVNKKEYIPKVDVSTLNSDQKESFDSLVDYITNLNDDSIYVLKGWAGTGKTYTISLLVKYILEVIQPTRLWYKVGVTGPTNKSVRVIRKATGISSSRVQFQTVHKILGLAEKITQDGQQIFVNDGEYKPQIKSLKLLIVDEVSMLNDDLFHELLKYRDKTKIIFMGDPAQIPPVGKPDCIPFRDELHLNYNIKTLNLKQIMRQKEGNPIIEASVKIRANLLNNSTGIPSKSNLDMVGEGIEFINLNSPESRSNFRSILEKYYNSENFKSNSEYCKIIAWRNKTVSSMNDLVRKVIYDEESTNSKILIGEKLIANSPILDGDSIIFNTNDEFSVESFEICETDLRFKISDHPDDDPYPITLKYYEATVSYLDEDDEVNEKIIQILHESSESDFKKLANILKLRAINKKGKDKSWLVYYNFLRRYADVSYGYSITSHKSQGSTYDTVFLLEDDIDMNYNVIERNRIKYTSYTRSSRKLYVVKRF